MGESEYVYFILLYSCVLTNFLLFRIRPPIQIRAIICIGSVSSMSSKSNKGSRLTVFVPLLSFLLDISDFLSNDSQSLVNHSSHSSYHAQNVDDTVMSVLVIQ